jgi:hypothetical protein
VRRVRVWPLLLCLIALVSVGIPAARASADTVLPWSSLTLYSNDNFVSPPTHQLFQQSAGTPIQAGGGPTDVYVTVGGPSSTGVAFAPISGDTLTVGTYTDTEGTLVHPGHPGLTLGTGAGCEDPNGQFTIEDIAFVNGIVTRLAATFVIPCSGTTFGEVRYNEPPTGALEIQASSLLLPAQYVGVANISVPLSVTNTSSAPVPVGPVTTSGMAAADIVIDGDTCPSLLGPAAACVITVTLTPLGVGVRPSAITIASGSVSASASFTDTGIAGNAAFALDGSPDNVSGSAQLVSYNQVNSEVTATGGTSGVTVDASTNGVVQYEAYLTAPFGQNLAVGDYLDAQGEPTGDQPVFIVSQVIPGEESSCLNFVGQFTVQQIAFDADGRVTELAVDAQGQCSPEYPELFVSLRLASSIGYSAVAIQPSQTTASPPVTYPTEALGRTSPAQTVTITNSGGLPVSVAPAITGANAEDFQITTSTCAGLSPLSPGSSCSTSVAFDPQAAGTLSAALVFTDSTPRGQHPVALAGTGVTSPTFTYPVAGGPQVDTTKPFTWITSPGAQANRLVIGTAAGADDLLDSGILPAGQTSYSIGALPVGSLFATVSTEANGAWSGQSVVFNVVPQVAGFVEPLELNLNAYPAPFAWTTGSHDGGYDLVVGTTPGSANLINSGVLPPTQGSYSPPPLPANTRLYATIFTEWYGSWSFYRTIDFVVQATQATFTSPFNGQQVVDSAAPFTWSTAAQAQAYDLVVSTTPGGANLVNSGVLPPTRTYYPAVPLPRGVTLYATIFTKIGGSWNYFQSITFSAGPAAPSAAVKVSRR